MKRRKTDTMAKMVYINSEPEECRFCGATLEGDGFDLFSIIFDILGNTREPMHIAFQNVTGIVISVEDFLRRSVCETCHVRLKAIIIFRKIGRESYKKVIAAQQKVKLLAQREKLSRLKIIRCLICFKTDFKLTAISTQTDSISMNPEASLPEMYGAIIGISVPDEPTFLCKECIESLREFFRNRLSFMKVPIGTKRLFKCKYCNAMFSSFQICKLHIQTHQIERQNVCKICYKAFITSDHLIKHLEKHYKEDDSKCSICLGKCVNFVTYQAHFPCSVNDWDVEATSKSTTELESFQEFQSPDEICGCHNFKNLANQSKWTRHLKLQHSKNFCQICQRFFLANSRFFLHMDTHISENYYFCRLCFKQFNNISSYEYHALVVHSKNVCRKCTFMCEPKVPLEHFKDHVKNLVVPMICITCSEIIGIYHTCEICGFRSTILSFYIDHMMNLHKVLPQQVKYPSNILQKHMRIHRNDHQMTCRICLENFGNVPTYLEHTENEHPKNICKICSKVFTTIGIMRQHLKRHSQKRKNLCNICAKLFSNSKSYRRHRRKKHN